MDFFLDPTQQEVSDLKIVLFEHHHVPVAADTALLHANEIDGHARLPQVGRRAMVVGRVVGTFGHRNEYWNFLEVHQFACGIGLQCARN